MRIIMVVNRKFCFLVKDLNGNDYEYMLYYLAYYIAFISEGNYVTLRRKIIHINN